jgi:hypothetical protein
MLKQRGQAKRSHLLHGRSLQKVACMAKNALAQATRDQADRLDPCLCDIMYHHVMFAGDHLTKWSITFNLTNHD